MKKNDPRLYRSSGAAIRAALNQAGFKEGIWPDSVIPEQQAELDMVTRTYEARRVATCFLNAVQRRRWHSAVRWTQKTWKVTIPRKQRKGRIQRLFGGKRLEGFEITGTSTKRSVAANGHRYTDLYSPIVDVLFKVDTGDILSSGTYTMRLVCEVAPYQASIAGTFGVNVTSVRRVGPPHLRERR